jgi:hypothetical protein
MMKKMMKKKGMARGGKMGMKKKGYAKGGMKKKGYAKGGTMKKKGMAKGGAQMTLAKIRAAAKAKGYKLVKV